MSCDYDVYCMDCHLGLEDWDQDIDECRSLVAHAAELATIYAVSQALPPSLGIILTHDFQSGSNLKFFEDHAGHHLVVRDEYGRNDGQCPKTYKCPACECPHPCTRPVDHEGDCGPEVKP